LQPLLTGMSFPLFSAVNITAVNYRSLPWSQLWNISLAPNEHEPPSHNLLWRSTEQPIKYCDST
jgi:hypothetical protein